MIPAVRERPVRRGHGRHHHHRRAQAAGRLLRPLHAARSSSCWCGPTRSASPTPQTFAADPELLVGARRTTNFYTAVYDILDGDEANPRIKLFETFGATVQALHPGDVDIVLMDAASGKGYIGADPAKLKMVGGPSVPRTSASFSSRDPTWSRRSTPPCHDESRRLPGEAEQQVVLRVPAGTVEHVL